MEEKVVRRVRRFI